MPIRTIRTKFYVFSQNNIQGKYMIQEDVGINEETIIEHFDYKSAFYKYKEIIENYFFYSDFCECCGFRWVQEDDEPEDGYDDLKFLNCNRYFNYSLIYFDNRIVSLKVGKNKWKRTIKN